MKELTLSHVQRHKEIFYLTNYKCIHFSESMYTHYSSLCTSFILTITFGQVPWVWSWSMDLTSQPTLMTPWRWSWTLPLISSTLATSRPCPTPPTLAPSPCSRTRSGRKARNSFRKFFIHPQLFFLICFLLWKMYYALPVDLPVTLFSSVCKIIFNNVLDHVWI